MDDIDDIINFLNTDDNKTDFEKIDQVIQNLNSAHVKNDEIKQRNEALKQIQQQPKREYKLVATQEAGQHLGEEKEPSQLDQAFEKAAM